MQSRHVRNSSGAQSGHSSRDLRAPTYESAPPAPSRASMSSSQWPNGIPPSPVYQDMRSEEDDDLPDSPSQLAFYKFKNSVDKGKGKSFEYQKKDTHPDVVVKEDVFDSLAYCGFLEFKYASLVRWAADVVWKMMVYRESRCRGKHISHVSRTIPPVLFRLFAANAILPHSIRASATARALIVLHALNYLSRVPTCAFCYDKNATQLDLTAEDPKAFGGAHPSVISKTVIEWSVGVRCAVAWLVDLPELNYWESFTMHIPDKVGASVLRHFQQTLDYRFSIPTDRLLALIDAITDDHPLSLRPDSQRKYCPPPGLHPKLNVPGGSGWNSMISIA
ncbi:hypothetical protein CPB86DRAFT_590323 [Serendipita vermifera]|nr:hypothetical protein CPB86DRAFT_590323 [Serendipita vermifera]